MPLDDTGIMDSTFATPSATQRPNATELLAHWLADASSHGLAQQEPDLEGSYAAIWHAWLQSLGPRSSPFGDDAGLRSWDEAGPDDVVHFLQIRAGQRAHHQPDRQISEVTRRRYWRVLDRIYAHAVVHGWLERSPVGELQWQDRPAPVEQLGHTLPPPLWDALPAHFPPSDKLQNARDRAILSLLYDLALAPEEVRNLKDEHLLDDLHRPVDLRSGQAPAAIHIEGARKAQERTLPLPARTAQALQAWLAFRMEHGADNLGWVFYSRKGGPLSIRALFHTASKVIQQAHASLPNAAEDFPLHRVGPQVIRNTAIVAWLRTGMNETELTRFIGVDGPRALLHLRYQWPVLAEAVPPPPAAATE